jgi:hypothetical protein
MNRRAAPLFVIATLATFMAACSSQKSQSPPQPPAISLAINTVPPSTMDMNATAQIAATVANDSANEGVDWSCIPAAACGTFTPAHTASGASTTYQAPSVAGTVTITATSTAANSITQSVTITVNPITISITTAPSSSLDMNATAQLAAMVANDSVNAGVDWSCTPAAACGTFTPSHTASAANTAYQAPNAAGMVTITAASATEAAVTKSVTVTISPITISVTAPPASMEINGTAQIAGTVANDLPNAGVDWSCTPVGACGTFTPAHTASAADTTYQAPSAPSTVTITAASTTEPTVKQSMAVTIGPVGTTSSLKGTYTFYANGWDSIFDPYDVVGSIVLDGNGNVTGGEQDYFDLASGGVIDTADPIAATGGTISVGADGRGTLTFTPTIRGTAETFSIVLVNNDHLLITEFDSSATSAGSMDLQTSPASVPTGGNAFALFDAWDRDAIGGVITSTGTTTTAEEVDWDFAGSRTFDYTTNGDTISAPDAAGRGTMTLVGMKCAYYVVGPEVFRLIEIDGNTPGGLFFSGSMYGQGTTAGAFSSRSLASSYVFIQTGQDNNPNGIFYYSVAGEFTTDTTSKFTAGVADVNEGDGNPIFAASLAGSTYTVKSDGYGSTTLATALDGNLQNFGVYLVDPALNITDPNSTTGGGGAFLLDLDANNFGIGFIAPETSGAGFAGNYAFNQDGWYQTATLNPVFDLIGQVLSDGTSTLTGKADYNDLGNTGLNPGDTITATFTPDSVNAGRSTAQLRVTGTSGTTIENITLYQASDGLLLHVDMDSPAVQLGNSAVGVFEKQQ